MRLIADDLACDRGGRRVLDGVSFAVSSGEALIVTGPNGGGKSTLIRLIAGFLTPARGMITLEGGDPTATLPEQTHVIGHHDALKPQLTLTETVAFWAEMLGGEPLAAERALDAVDLGHLADLPAGVLSAGQRRRLALARLVAAHRPIWLLDEPTTAIDAASEARLDALMAAHLKGGGIIVAATHAPLSLGEAKRLKLGAVT